MKSVVTMLRDATKMISPITIVREGIQHRRKPVYQISAGAFEAER